jgi:hypothetical protein
VFEMTQGGARQLRTLETMAVQVVFRPTRIVPHIGAHLRVKSTGAHEQLDVALKGTPATPKAEHADQRELSVAEHEARSLVVAGTPSVQHYSDMLAAVLAARSITDRATPGDTASHAQINKLLEPVERRLNQLNDHHGRLAQFGAGNIAGQASLDMSETAVRSWRQRLALGTVVRTEEFVTRFRAGAEAIRFLTGERADAPTLREFDHVSGLVGIGAAVAVLAPALIPLAAEEAAALAFVGRTAALRIATWAVAHPAAALAAAEALLGFGVQIGEGGWEAFWNQLHDPQGRWFVVAQILMDYMHVKGSMHGYDGSSSTRRPTAPSVEPVPDLEGARQRLARARAVLQQVNDGAANEPGHGGVTNADDVRVAPAPPNASVHEPISPASHTASAEPVEPPARGPEADSAGLEHQPPAATTHQPPGTSTTPSHQQPPAAAMHLEPPADGDGGPASWVDENAHMLPGAREYQDSAHGARSNPATKAPQAPELEYRAADGSKQKVRFDGVEGRQMIDRKKAVTTFPKSERQALRQSEALRQNGLSAVWEVPSAAEATRATRLLSKLNIANITVRIVKL